jgi:hypothetical protein
MKCHLCGKPLGIAIGGGETDFCSTDHRKRFHFRLNKALTLLGRDLRNEPRPAPPIITYVPAVHQSRPAQSDDFLNPLRCPVACLAIVVDPPTHQGATFAAEQVKQQTTILLADRQNPSEVGRQTEGKRPDRLVVLGSRLRALRVELDRAAGVPRRLATA